MHYALVGTEPAAQSRALLFVKSVQTTLAVSSQATVYFRRHVVSYFKDRYVISS